MIASAISQSPLQGKRIALGISGGIAAYKAPLIIRLLIQRGATVRVLATANALQFTTRATLETLSENPLEADLFPTTRIAGTQHIQTAQWTDLFLLAPSTANLIGKISSGISDDVLTATLCAFNGPVMLAPSMNSAMYENPVTKKNLNFLRSIGIVVIDPDVGEMACHTFGVGRMAEPERIVSEVVGFFANRQEKGAGASGASGAPCAPCASGASGASGAPEADGALHGQRVVVTAGPCREPLDPVRFISNYSSGKMGYALAEAARDCGADVTLISGPTSLTPPANVALIAVETTAQMQTATLAGVKDADLLLMAAAPADYAPVTSASSKIKKSSKGLELSLRATPDILLSVAKVKSAHLFVIGFALETDALLENARLKLQAKDLDLIVANPAGVSDAGPNSDTNRAILITRDGSTEETPLLSKLALAELIFKRVAALRAEGTASEVSGNVREKKNER